MYHEVLLNRSTCVETCLVLMPSWQGGTKTTSLATSPSTVNRLTVVGSDSGVVNVYSDDAFQVSTKYSMFTAVVRESLHRSNVLGLDMATGIFFDWPINIFSVSDLTLYSKSYILTFKTRPP